MKKTLVLFAITPFLLSCSEKTSNSKNELSQTQIFIENKDSEYAKEELENAKISDEFSLTKVIPNPKTAVEISESILFLFMAKKTSSNKDLMM